VKAASDEQKKQEDYLYSKSVHYAEYGAILGYYQVQSCLEHMHGVSHLDLACGDGLLTEQFRKKFPRVVGVDASRRHLEKARERCPDVEFHNCLIEELEMDEQFDNVTLINILEHVRNPVDLLKKSASFLKRDGVLIIHVPNANAINRRIAVLMGTLKRCDELSPFDKRIAGHRRSYTQQSLLSEIQKAGLITVASGGIFFKMLSTPQFDWFLKNGLWDEGGFGWGRVGSRQKKDWRAEFCRACYELGKEYPDDCNLVYAVVSK
jgi:ubiquinone/menaquinone biosynthesis C-methylase UbiE